MTLQTMAVYDERMRTPTRWLPCSALVLSRGAYDSYQRVALLTPARQADAPAWTRWLSEVQPFTPAVDLLRNLLVHTPLRDGVLVDLLKLG